MRLFGRRGQSKHNELKKYIINSNILNDSQYFLVSEIMNHEKDRILDIHFNRSITLFDIKILFNIILPGNKIEQFSFEKLNVDLIIKNHVMFTITPHIYDSNTNHIDNLKYIKTDIISLHFPTNISSDFKESLVRKLIDLIERERKLFLNN